MKQVKNSSQAKSFYFTIFNQIKEGKNPAKICKDLSISKQKLNYYIRRLKKEGHIVKRGYGVWEALKEVKISTKDTYPKEVKTVRGHAFIWNIKLPREIKGWLNRKEILAKNNIAYKEVGLKGTPRIFVNKRKVWLGSKTLTIYEPASFYGSNAIESKKYAVITLLETLKKIESKLGINLRPYTFKPAREHYGLLKNDLAVQCNRNKEKIAVRDIAGQLWLWVDDSLGLGELETGGVQALPNNLGVQKWFNDHKKHNFEITPTFILNTMNGIQQNQLVFDRNMKSHLEILKRLGDEVQGLSKTIKEFKNE